MLEPWRSMRRRCHEAIHSRLPIFGKGRWAKYARPTAIQCLVTERCNARCVHCDIWTNRGQESSPSLEQWQAALTDLRAWLGPVHVVLTGGEALLRPFTLDLVEHGVRLGLFMEVLTHGYWGDQERIERLARAGPWRVTLSLDGIGATHDRIRGREGFFERTANSIETLKRVRREHNRRFAIRLKTVVMDHNLGDLEALARFATQDGVDILYQPIEQNYNTNEDSEWFTHSDNWPRDAEQAVRAVDALARLKREGLAIANSEAELTAMGAYFRDPARWRLVTQEHVAAMAKVTCAALSLFQVQADGSVRTCLARPSVGNIKETRPRDIWRARPRFWDNCCLRERLSPAERERLVLPARSRTRLGVVR
jgi:MoaA/NifB/PqqE/SkfB family radical SAM enzyme